MSDTKAISLTYQTPGHAHTKFGGRCGPDVTVEDIEKRYYHPNFGGREAWVRNGEWGCIRHDD